MNQDEIDELSQQANLNGIAQQANQSASAAQYYLEEQEKNLAETQLEIESVISKCYHLLKQDVYKPDDSGNFDWVELSDPKKRALSDWGVDRIMQLINFYVNKNTLLSNFSEEQINRIMLRFMVELNSLFLMKYEFLFRQPTFEECRDILNERLDNQVKLKSFAIEVLGIIPDKKKIKEDVLKEVEYKIEKEIEKIRNEKRKENLREYGLLIAQLEQIVYSTLNRAWKGEERGSIRRHTNISEIIGGSKQVPNTPGGFSKWFGR